MGLDIWLHERSYADASIAYYAAEQKYESEHPDATYDEMIAAIGDGPNISDEINTVNHVTKSHKYPEHYWTRRYMRSSYNGAGFNAAVPEMIGESDKGSIYWCFEPMERVWDGDNGYLTEDDLGRLAECRKRAEEVVAALQAADPLRTFDATAYMGAGDHTWQALPTEAQVLAWYREEVTRDAEMKARAEAEGRTPFRSDSYSNAKGTVLGFEKGMEVLAVTVGQNIIGTPCAIVVFRLGEEGKRSYIEAAEIMIEFIDEAVMLIKRDGAVQMSWSG